MIYSNKKGGINMIPLKKVSFTKPSKYSEDYKEKLCDNVTGKVHNNLKSNRNRKLI